MSEHGSIYPQKSSQKISNLNHFKNCKPRKKYQISHGFNVFKQMYDKIESLKKKSLVDQNNQNTFYSKIEDLITLTEDHDRAN